MVYVAEAHASDVWPVGRGVSFCPAPATSEARASLVRGLASTVAGHCLAAWPRGTVLMDGPGDGFLRAFDAWPVRFFALTEAAEGGGGGDGFTVALKGVPRDDDCA